MANLFIAGVGNVDLFKGTESVLVSKTLVDSSINLSVSLEDIRAGAGAKLYGRYAHSSGMTMKLTDAMFRMEFLAANIGADVELGGTAVAMIPTTVLAGGKVSIERMEIAKIYEEMEKAIVWAAKADGKMEFIPFEVDWDAVNNKPAQTEITGLPWAEGTNVCIRHIKPYDAGQTLKVSANFIPDTLTAVLTAPLFAGDQSNLEASTKVGTLTITIPRFMLNGTTDLAMSMTGAAQMTLEGSALAVEDVACDGEGYYAIISKVLTSGNWYDDLVYILIENGEDLESGDTLKIYGCFAGGGFSPLDENKYKVEYDESVISYVNGVLTNLTNVEQEFTIVALTPELQKVIGSLAGRDLTEEELERVRYYGDPNVIPTDESLFAYEINDDDTVTLTGYNVASSSTSSKELRVGVSETDIVIPYQINGKLVTKIGESAFESSFDFENVILPNSVKYIGAKAFWESRLSSIVIPNSVKEIGVLAFSGTQLTKIDIPASVEKIDDYAFQSVDTGSLKFINVDEANLFYSSINGHLFDKEKKTLITYCANANEESYTVPETVEIIEKKAFSYTHLNTIVIGDNVKVIKNDAFDQYSILQTIYLGSGIEKIEARAFNSFMSCLETVYYNGTRKEWNSLDIVASGNDNLLEANIVFSKQDKVYNNVECIVTIAPAYSGDEELVVKFDYDDVNGELQEVMSSIFEGNQTIEILNNIGEYSESSINGVFVYELPNYTDVTNDYDVTITFNLPTE